MEKLAYSVNIDYEFSLFDPHYFLGKYEKINKELEYLFFWVESDGMLSSEIHYSEDYLNYIKSFKKIPGISPKPGIFWWGNLKDIILEKKWNSKITTTDLANNLGILDFQRKVIEAKEINKYKRRDVLIKHPYLFSGMRNKKGFESSHYIVEKKQNRIMDFSTLNFKQIYFYQNFIGHSMSWNGAQFIQDESEWRKYLKENNVLESSQKIIERQKNVIDLLPSDKIWNIDSFVYESGVDPLTEINFRKTMGYVLICLSKIISTKPVVRLSLLNRPKDISFSELAEKISPQILLSPCLSHQNFILVFSQASSSKMIDIQIKKLNKIISNR